MNASQSRAQHHKGPQPSVAPPPQYRNQNYEKFMQTTLSSSVNFVNGISSANNAASNVKGHSSKLANGTVGALELLTSRNATKSLDKYPVDQRSQKHGADSGFGGAGQIDKLS